MIYDCFEKSKNSRKITVFVLWRSNREKKEKEREKEKGKKDKRGLTQKEKEFHTKKCVYYFKKS